MTLSTADYAILVGFFAVMLAVGIYFSTRMKDLQDYFSGGHRVPWWLSGISLYMSSFSTFLFVAYSAVAYQHGFVAVTACWTAAPAMLISAYFFAPRWRRATSTSPLEYIEKRFGRALRQGLAWMGVPMTVIDDGLKLFAIGTLISSGLGIEKLSFGRLEMDGLNASIFVSGAIMLAYTFLGGLWAVLITDFVQFLVMLVAVIALIPLALSRVGGFEGFVNGLPEGFFHLTSEKYNWVYLASFLVIMVLSYCTRWSFVQRYYSVESDREARRVGYLVTVLAIIGPPILFFPAMAATIFLPEVQDPNEVYMLLCKSLLPVGMIGMMIAAMFSATLSMLSSDYNAVAAVLTNDVYRPLFAPHASNRALVLVGRLSTLLVGITALGIGMMVANAVGENDLFQLMARLFGVFMPPIAVPMLAGLLSRKVSHGGGFLGFLLGITVGLLLYFCGNLAGLVTGNAELATHLNGLLRWLPVMTSATVGTTLVGLGVGTLLFPNSPEQRERVARFLEGVEVYQGALVDQPPTTESSVSPAPIIGVSVGTLGIVVILAVILTEPVKESILTLCSGSVLVLTGLMCWFLSRQNRKRKNPQTDP